TGYARLRPRSVMRVTKRVTQVTIGNQCARTRCDQQPKWKRPPTEAASLTSELRLPGGQIFAALRPGIVNVPPGRSLIFGQHQAFAIVIKAAQIGLAAANGVELVV